VKKKISLGSVLLVVLIVATLTFQITYSLIESKYQEKMDIFIKSAADFSKLSIVDERIRDNFFGSIDEGLLEDWLVRGYVNALNDPYSRYLNEKEYSEYLSLQNSSKNGIGVRLAYDEKNSEIIIFDCIPASPSASSGLKKGDVIDSVDGVAASELGYYGVLRALAGNAGTTVKVTVRRMVALQSLKMNFTLQRAEVSLNCLSYEKMNNGIGYVLFHSFGEGVSEELRAALADLQSGEIGSLIFDVRNCTESHWEDALRALDLIVKGGTLTLVEDAQGTLLTKESNEDGISLPITVLINKNTAGAAELFAAALRDESSAKLVGEKSFGKATDQMLVELDDGSALFLTHCIYYPPLSESFHSVGLSPDVLCEMDANFYLLTHKEDTQLQKAIETLQPAS